MLLTRFRRNHHLGFALGLLALGLAPQAAIGSDTPEKILASSLIGALICAVAMATSDPAALGWRRPADQSGRPCPERPSRAAASRGSRPRSPSTGEARDGRARPLHTARARASRARPSSSEPLIAALLAAAAGCGVLGWLALNRSSWPATPVELAANLQVRTVQLLAIFLASACFEELLFRGVLYADLRDALARQGAAHPARSGALIAGVAFGLLHLSGPLAVTIDAPVVIQAVLKVASATAFGICLAAIYQRCGSIWPGVLTHAGYNLLEGGTLAWTCGALPGSYLTGQPCDLAVLAVETCCLAVIGVLAWQELE